MNLKNPKYVEIDGIYFSGLIVVDYLREYDDLIFKNIIDNNENIDISIFFEKQDKYKVIKDLTYNIGSTKIDIEKIGEMRADSEIAAFSLNDAKYIRKEMQINNEEMYFIYTYIMAHDVDKKKLEIKINKIEGMLKSNGIIPRKGMFRQELIFKSMLPFMKNYSGISESARRNILTNSIGTTFPFISSSMKDKEGILLGTNLQNNSLIFLNKFNRKKYKNSNMCVFGASGSGKSYFTKLMILRENIFGKKQYVIDPDREYGNIAKALDGSIIKIGPGSKSYINVFDIRKESLEENQSGFLQTKISKLMGFFKLIIENMSDKEKFLLEEKIIQMYQNFGINFDDSSLYENGKFKTSKEMPVFEDLYNLLEGELKNKIYPFVKGSLKFFNERTNINLEKDFIVGDVYELGEENLKYGMFIFTELFWDKIKQNRKENKIIYLDEIWKLIGVTSNKEVAGFIYKIFKTIRKYGGSATAISQDVSDLFSLQEGAFGKSILNNSEFKVFFNMEEENLKVLEENIDISQEERMKIKGLSKGRAVFFINKIHVEAEINSSEYENQIIIDA